MTNVPADAPTINVYYYDRCQGVSTLSDCQVLATYAHGIRVLSTAGVETEFPWTSVQRFTYNTPKA